MDTVFGQCTITQPNILNPSVLPGGIAKFDLTFKHERNGGNKWVTIHLWKSQDYPTYDYDRVPTTTRLGGVAKRPFGTIVINNEVVDHSGTYTNAQAFVGAYQNDGDFVIINTSTSTLTYNATNGTYTLSNLQVILPAGITAIKYDSWSSQSSYNSNVHCFNCNAGIILVPSVLAVKYSQPFKAQKSSGNIVFSWTTSSEDDNSHFVIEHLEDGNWKQVVLIGSGTEDGHSDVAIPYSYVMKIPAGKGDNRTAALLIGLGVLAGAVAMRSIIPARLSILICVVCGCALGGCEDSKSDSDTLQRDHFYRLGQVSKNGNILYSDTEMVKF